jgi:hypothetical protein
VIPDFGSPGAAIGLGWRVDRWDGRAIIGHDGDTVGQSAYLRIDPQARVAACLLTDSGQSGSLYRAVFTEVFGSLDGVRMPACPQPAVEGAGDLETPDLGWLAGRYERASRRLDVSVRDGGLHVVLTPTGELATLIDSQPMELSLYPADTSGLNFVCRTHDDQPWHPLSFGALADGIPYVFLGGRITPRVE